MYAFLLFFFVRVICGGGGGARGGGGVLKVQKLVQNNLSEPYFCNQMSYSHNFCNTACKISKMIKTAFSVFIFLVEYRS